MSSTHQVEPAVPKENMAIRTLSENDLQKLQPEIAETQENVQKRDLRFWMCFVAIMIATILNGLDFAGLTVALPVILHDLNGVQFEWVGSAYALASTAFLPLTGGLAQVFGRRSVMLSQIFLFALGSAVCGAAPSMGALIAGRTIQGVGSGGIISLTQIIVADLVPLHERGTYNGLIALAYLFGSIASPVIAGALAKSGQWRWFFYLNLPFCGLAGGLTAVYLKLKTPPGTFKEKLLEIDWIGNAIVMGSTTSVVLSLTWGGLVAPWGSARVIVPLVVGILGLVAFIVYEAKLPRSPLVPLETISNWTSISGYIQAACTAFCMLTLFYYLPLYYQACEGASPVGSGVDSLSTSFTLLPAGMIVGASVTKTGKYKPQLVVSWICMIVGSALFYTVHLHTHRGAVLGYQVLVSVGLGPLVTSLIFPVLAPLPVALNANALAFMAFVRFFAQVWGVTVGGTILQNELVGKLPANFASQFPSGTGLAYSIVPAIKNLAEPLRTEVKTAFAESIRPVWLAMLAASAFGFIISLTMKSLPLHDSLDEKWGLEENQMNQQAGPGA